VNSITLCEEIPFTFHFTAGNCSHLLVQCLYGVPLFYLIQYVKSYCVQEGYDILDMEYGVSCTGNLCSGNFALCLPPRRQQKRHSNPIPSCIFPVKENCGLWTIWSTSCGERQIELKSYFQSISCRGFGCYCILYQDDSK
jgi:hypothetical protein